MYQKHKKCKVKIKPSYFLQRDEESLFAVFFPWVKQAKKHNSTVRVNISAYFIVYVEHNFVYGCMRKQKI